jgi:hypothetical protein
MANESLSTLDLIFHTKTATYCCVHHNEFSDSEAMETAEALCSNGIHLTFCLFPFSVIFLSVSILFINPQLNSACRIAPHYPSSSALLHRNRDGLAQWPSRVFKSFEPFSSGEFIIMQKVLDSCINA